MAFRRHTLLPMDDCLYALQPSVPHLTRSALHRCLQRHGISRLPGIEDHKPKRQRLKPYPVGFFHIDIAEVQTTEGKLHLFVTSTGPAIRLLEIGARATGAEARLFLDELVAVVPYRLHTILTDSGIQFADLPKNRDGPTVRWRGHPFDRACQSHGIEYRLAKPNHPWTNGQVDRVNRTIKNATVKRHHYDSHDQLRRHLADYNFAGRLKTLGAPKVWTSQPDRYIIDPSHQMPGLNI